MLGSRSFYAKHGEIIYAFQDKVFRDWYIQNTDAVIISAKSVYNDYHCNTVKINHHTFRKFKEFMGNAYK